MNNNSSQLETPIEVLAPITTDELRSPPGLNGGGGHVNKFLLCTLVCGMAREIRVRAAQSGQTVPLLKIVREVLRSHLEERPVGKGLSAEGQLLDEEVLRNEIERKVQEYLKQALEHRAEARRLDLETIAAARAAKPHRGTVTRGWLSAAE
ncbi:MAG TPA: hypothetical protein VJ302_21470 [Blastocatellia bacterium]|nr:hypothetical protein [Blastocatellia bacterium]